MKTFCGVEIAIIALIVAGFRKVRRILRRQGT